MTKVKRKADMPVAMIPLLFGVQQLIEGVIWLSFAHHASSLNTTMTYGYSLFAFVLWPIFIPFAIRLWEPQPRRQKTLYFFQAAGLAVGGYLLYSHTASPITSAIVKNNIVYNNSHFFGVGVIGFYFVSTVGSCLFSSDRTLKLFGVLAFMAALVAYWVHASAFVSIWCFFAAILSVMIYVVITRKRVEIADYSRSLLPNRRALAAIRPAGDR